ncbi:acyl-CoA thioesterase [Polaribacter sp.]|uniref:acyl-CoA thioesterase n=1 Tax=Polaribacter sp. TaxID=1920175 RepID=UPI003EFA2A86
MKKKQVAATKLKATHQIRVRFNETDPLGIVWHGNYIKYFEDGREAFGRKFGISYLDVHKHGFATPIVKSSCEHKLPLKYGELANIEATYINSPAAKMIFSYSITNEAGNIVCIGETVQVFVDDNGILSLTNPSFFEEWKQQMDID